MKDGMVDKAMAVRRADDEANAAKEKVHAANAKANADLRVTKEYPVTSVVKKVLGK